MGRPPCCDKDGIKKGPWTPEEDIILVSYIQEHGPGNWRSVPTNTGLLRCSKSCRLRWTNYLRPGIKRGNFTSHEEGMIIHLQALLGNKWAAIASYLPQRTDNDIKNYWNTHLKKKLKRFQSAFQQADHPQTTPISSSSSIITAINDNNPSQFSPNNKSCINHDFVQQQQQPAPAPAPPVSASCYASSTENISRLLENWMKCSPMSKAKARDGINNEDDNNNNNNNIGNNDNANVVSQDEEDDHFESMLSFDNHNNDISHATTTIAGIATCESMEEEEEDIDHEEEIKGVHETTENEIDDENEDNPPLTFLEKWLLDETSTTSSRQAVEEILQLPPIF